MRATGQISGDFFGHSLDGWLWACWGFSQVFPGKIQQTCPEFWRTRTIHYSKFSSKSTCKYGGIGSEDPASDWASVTFQGLLLLDFGGVYYETRKGSSSSPIFFEGQVFSGEYTPSGPLRHFLEHFWKKNGSGLAPHPHSLKRDTQKKGRWFSFAQDGQSWTHEANKQIFANCLL